MECRIITPERRIANVRAALADLVRSRRHRGRKAAITATQAQLADLERQYAAGTLEAIIDDGVPF